MTGKFIVDNYKQALDILLGEKDVLKAMENRGIQSADFTQWVEEECSYLASLKKEPEEETLQIMYYEQLVKLETAK